MTKPTTTVAVPDNSKAPLNVERAEDEGLEVGMARTALRPSVQAAMTIQKWGIFSGKHNINSLAAELQSHANAASGNELGRMEAMLVSQAHTLDAVFNELARLARMNLLQNLDAADKLLRLALKAQSQCRGNIEALAEIKNPKAVAFVQQANIAAGHQQVNNDGISRPVRAPAPARVGIQNQTNELMEGRSHGNGLERGTAGESITGHSTMEAVGAIDGAKIAGREGKGRRKQP